MRNIFSREVVRKKTILVLFRFWKLNPEAFDFIQYFHQSLFDTDPATMQSSLTAYNELIQVCVALSLIRIIMNIGFVVE